MNCGRIFKTKRKKQKYCSYECFLNSGMLKRNRVERVRLICHYCKKEFYILPSDYRKKIERGYRHFFCSVECSSKYLNPIKGRKRVKVYLKICEFCKREFYTKNKKQRFCSRKCVYNYRRRWRIVELSCNWCGKKIKVNEYYIMRYKFHFCSRECQRKFHSVFIQKENNPNWRGGKTYEPYSPDFNKVLKKYIKERDSYTCQLCGITLEELKRIGVYHNLYVHHIDMDKNNNSPYNLVTLCDRCHGKVHYDKRFIEVLKNVVVENQKNYNKERKCSILQFRS